MKPSSLPDTSTRPAPAECNFLKDFVSGSNLLYAAEGLFAPMLTLGGGSSFLFFSFSLREVSLTFVVKLVWWFEVF